MIQEACVDDAARLRYHGRVSCKVIPSHSSYELALHSASTCVVDILYMRLGYQPETFSEHRLFLDHDTLDHLCHNKATREVDKKTHKRL